MTLRLNPANTWGNENSVVESLIVEAISMYGQDFYYIPRTLVSKDNIVGEDRLSKFKNAYPIICYMENNSGGFEGQGAMASKFGLQIDYSATLSVARKEWNKAVGRYGTTILPHRPAEGDLLYFPMTSALLEITFVQHQAPFYQVGQLYVYQLSVQLFSYGSEHITTGVPAIDAFESLKSFDVTVNPNPDIPGKFGNNTELNVEKTSQFFDKNNPFGAL